MPRLIAGALTLGALLWCATLLFAPLALRGAHPRLALAAASVYRGAALICHQRPERSFHLAGVQLPVCARCAGLYISGCIGALAAWIGWRRPRVPRGPRRAFWARWGGPRGPRRAFRARWGGPGWVRTALAVAAIPTAVTVGVEFLGVAYPSNAARAISALPLGAIAGWVFVRSLRMEGTGPAPDAL